MQKADPLASLKSITPAYSTFDSSEKGDRQTDIITARALLSILKNPTFLCVFLESDEPSRASPRLAATCTAPALPAPPALYVQDQWLAKSEKKAKGLRPLQDVKLRAELVTVMYKKSLEDAKRVQKDLCRIAPLDMYVDYG